MNRVRLKVLAFVASVIALATREITIGVEEEPGHKGIPNRSQRKKCIKARGGLTKDAQMFNTILNEREGNGWN